MLHIRTHLVYFYACSEDIFPLTGDFQSVFHRNLQGFIQISDVKKKYSNVHFSRVNYWSHVTKNGCKKVFAFVCGPLCCRVES